MSMMNEKEYTEEKFDLVLWKKLLGILWEHKRLVKGLIFFNILIAANDIIFPLLNRTAINEFVLNKGVNASLTTFCIIYVVMILFKSFSLLAFYQYAGHVESDFGKNLRKKCFDRVQQLSFPYFDRTANGWVMARISSDCSGIAETLAWGFVDLFWGLFLMIGLTIVMLVIDWKMALAVLLIVPVLFVISLYFQKRILKAQRATRKSNSLVTAGFAESINGAKTTKALGMEEKNYEEFKEKTLAYKKNSLKAVHLNSIFQPIVYLLAALVIAMLMIIGGQEVLLGTIQFGTLSMFINYADLFFEPLKQIARIMSEVQVAQANGERIISLIEEPIEIHDRADVIEKYGELLNPKKENYEELHGTIDFNHVDFYYNENEPVLHDFDLHVKQGSMVALVGETGSGKSTIVNLLCRFYEPRKGSIWIDGHDIQDRSVGWLHSNIGYVLQTPSLFSGTIMDNIRFGRPDATEEEVIAVAKLIHAHDFIMKTEKGYQSEVGEGGDLLSTGQKQLLSFARALLSDPRIVILDEATSSIDTESEKLIQNAIAELLKDRTSFVVAHRLSTIVDADLILVLDHGKVMEQGTHHELMKKKGMYYELYTSQALDEKAMQSVNRKSN